MKKPSFAYLLHKAYKLNSKLEKGNFTYDDYYDVQSLEKSISMAFHIEKSINYRDYKLLYSVFFRTLYVARDFLNIK